MDNQLYWKIYDEICQRIVYSNISMQKDIDMDLINGIMSGQTFGEELQKMMRNKDYSCKSTYILCKDFLSELKKIDTVEQVLKIVYNFALYKAFPHLKNRSYECNLHDDCMLYLTILSVIADFQKQSEDDTWQSKYPLNFLSESEANLLDNKDEYDRLIKAYKEDFIYEIMKLSIEVEGFNTLDHVCGVTHIALELGKGLKAAGLPLDLGKVMGAAIGHDIGKYGCTADEFRRVPYLHYYYTDIWFKRYDINAIGHIAVNHSTWDLELENLPLESLILIYSDFRVKNIKNEDGSFSMHIFDLEESFDVILNKLDDMDDKKLRRYERVYSKLKDFQNYVNHIMEKSKDGFMAREAYFKSSSRNTYSLLQGEDIIQCFKLLAIDHNIKIMNNLKDEASLNDILETARSERYWQSLREYLNVIEEYSTYFTRRQKLITLNFLYESLTHNEDDIRRQCAKMVGFLTAYYDEDYRKEVPQNVVLEKAERSSLELFENYLEDFLFPDHKIIPMHRIWIVQSLPVMVASVLSNCADIELADYISIVMKYYKRNEKNAKEVDISLLEMCNNIIRIRNDELVIPIYDFLWNMLGRDETDLRILALSTINTLLPQKKLPNDFVDHIKTWISEQLDKVKTVAERFLILKISRYLYSQNDAEDIMEEVQHSSSVVSDIFLKNLKTATEWIIKRENIDFLLEHANRKVHNNKIHTAMHFCNLLKVSEVQSVRAKAGEALVTLMSQLTYDERNDIAIELLRSLEIEGYQYSENISFYLGQILIYLEPKELDELLNDLIGKMKQSNPNIKTLLLKTLGVLIDHYSKYVTLYGEDEEKYKKRLKKILGIILNSLADFSDRVVQTAFSVLGKYIFASKRLSLEGINFIFTNIAKKLLTLFGERDASQLHFFANAAALNHVYRFICDYIFSQGNIQLPTPKRVAFFPGTFDPFSLGHKEIAKAIRDMGFEVYLAVDEFSWSKKTHPHLLRKNIINMSVADELDIYLYPEVYPVNLTNEEDLKTLKSYFPKSEVYIVVGSDVVLNASAYKMKRSENSIHTFPHIIFERRIQNQTSIESQTEQQSFKQIEKEVIRLTLEPQYEDISSTQIRDYVDRNKDISSLIDPLAQKYIYENGFYQKEPQYKSVMGSISIDFQLIKDFDKDIVAELESFFYRNEIPLNDISQLFNGDNARALVVRDLKKEGEIAGFSLFHRVGSIDLFLEFRDSSITQYLREKAAGRIMLIDGIYTSKESNIENIRQIILTEILAYGVLKDYGFAVFSSNDELLELQGFERIPFDKNGIPIYMVNMNNPCTMNLDIERTLKEPFLSNGEVKLCIERCRRKIQLAMSKLYTGNLLLSFYRNIMDEALIKKICKENEVGTVPQMPRHLGKAMCVPFGDMLNRQIIPNTVTKTMHTEKSFAPDMKSYQIGPFPYYLDLDIQVRMIKSFQRPVILVDDILNKGYRIKAIDPLLKNEDVNVQKIVVGIMSAKGKEIMDLQNREVDCAYFIPNLRLWFNENQLYPFVGGNAIWRGGKPQRNLIPSVNLILPYMSPGYMRDASKSAIYNLSKVCIENALDLFTTIEREYENIYERNLTLSSLGQVFIAPRCPEAGHNMYYDLNIAPSFYIRNDLETLIKLEHSLNM